MRYVLYVKQTCPFCVKAQELLEKQDANFKAVVLGCPNIIERAIKVNKSKMTMKS